MAIDDSMRAATGKTRGVLSQEIATWSTDPNFYGLLSYLPNPDAVLRKLGRSQEAYDAIATDAHVIGELRAIRAGLLDYEWRLQVGGPGRADKRALELCTQVFAGLPGAGRRWPDLIWQLAQAVFRGYQVHEVVWARQGDLLLPVRIVDRPARRFVFSPQGELRLLTRQNQTDGEPTGPYKWLTTRHMPSYDNPYGVAVFSACFWPYTFKHSGWRYFVKFAEKYGLPWAIGKYPLGTPKPQQDELAASLAAMIEDAVAAVPADGSVELIATTSGAGALPQERLIDLCNAELSKALTSQTLATEIQGQGSRAAAETHADRAAGIHSSDRAVIEDALSQLCAWIVELNIPGALPPRFEFFEEAQARADWTDVLDKARGYLNIPVEFAHDRLQIPMATKGQDVLPRAAAPTATPIGPAAQDGGDFIGHACPNCGASHDYAAGDDIERALTGQAVREADPLIAAMLEPVTALLQRAETVTEFRDGLLDLYPQIDERRLGELTSLALLTGTLQGMDEAR